MSFTLNCPKCNIEIEAEEEWGGQEAECPACGNSFVILKQIKTDTKCPNCTSAIPADAILCIKCGYDLRTGKKIVQKNTDYTPKITINWNIFVYSIILIALIFCGYWWHKHKPEHQKDKIIEKRLKSVTIGTSKDILLKYFGVPNTLMIGNIHTREITIQTPMMGLSESDVQASMPDAEKWTFIYVDLGFKRESYTFLLQRNAVIKIEKGANLNMNECL